jgi:hypothetical protein
MEGIYIQVVVGEFCQNRRHDTFAVERYQLSIIPSSGGQAEPTQAESSPERESNRAESSPPRGCLLDEGWLMDE